MSDIKVMLKDLGRKTMFDVSENEMDALVDEYHVFMRHVQALEAIDTDGVEPLAFPYVVETTYLRDDIPNHVISKEEALKNASSVLESQIKVPKVVG